MNHKNEIASEIADMYVKRFPDCAALTLAKKMYKENPIIFKTLDSARSAIRYRFGQAGEKKRNKALPEHKDTFREKRDTNPFKIPEPDREDYEPFTLPKSNNRILHIQDWHIPYHDIITIELAIKYAKTHDCNTLLIGYDFLDFYQLSRFTKDPRRRNFKGEIDVANAMLDILKKELPKAKIFFRTGNHDERLESYLRVKAPELLDMSEFRLHNLLHFGQRGITLINDKIIVRAGDLNIVHGNEFFGSSNSPVNPARGLYLKAGTNSLCGHFHKTSSHTDPNIENKLHGCWSVGCACGLHPEWARLTKWNNGFAFIIVNKDNSFHVNNYLVYGGKIL